MFVFVIDVEEKAEAEACKIVNSNQVKFAR